MELKHQEIEDSTVFEGLTLGQRMARGTGTEKIAIPCLIGDVEGVTDYVLEIAQEIAAKNGSGNIQIDRGKLPEIDGRLRRISRFGFQIVDNGAFEREDENYEIATVLLAKFRDDPSKVVPIVIPHKLSSGIGELLRDEVNRQIKEEYRASPLDLLRPRTGEIIRDWCHMVKERFGNFALCALALASLGGGLLWGVPKISAALVHHQDVAYSQSVRSADKWELLAGNVSEMPRELQLDAVYRTFSHDSDTSSQFFSDMDRMLSRNNPDAQVRAIRVATTLSSVETRRGEGGFFEYGVSHEVGKLVRGFGSLALSSPSGEVRREAVKGIDTILRSEPPVERVKDAARDVFNELSLRSPDQAIREAANEWLLQMK